MTLSCLNNMRINPWPEHYNGLADTNVLARSSSTRCFEGNADAEYLESVIMHDSKGKERKSSDPSFNNCL